VRILEYLQPYDREGARRPLRKNRVGGLVGSMGSCQVELQMTCGLWLAVGTCILTLKSSCLTWAERGSD
jgi:hypothetical protein